MMLMVESKTWLAWLNLLFFWVLVTVIGGMVTYPVFLLITVLTAGIWYESLAPAFLLPAAPLAGAVGGVCVGLGQWLGLRSWRTDARRWALATFLGWTLGVFVALLIFLWLLPDGIDYPDLIAPLAVGGAAAGLVQARLLKLQMTATAWWVLASAVGWLGGWVIALALASAFGQGLALTPIASLTILGALHGAFIGLESGVVLIFVIDFEKGAVE